MRVGGNGRTSGFSADDGAAPLRLGKEEHHLRIAQNLSAALAESPSQDAAARYAWLARAHEQDRARFIAVQRETASVVGLRNAVGRMNEEP